MPRVAIVGCGDVGLRVAMMCRREQISVQAAVRRAERIERLERDQIPALQLDLDARVNLPADIAGADLMYFVPPPKQGVEDRRAADLIAALTERRPRRAVVISTTGVYGDCRGAWVSEDRPLNPESERARRRADAERRWAAWAGESGVPLTLLRVPGIYARSRLPEARLRAGRPVIDPADCGYSNRVHADDLAAVCIAALRGPPGVYNVSDGQPGTISEFLLAAAAELGLPPPPLISMAAAREQWPEQRLSFYTESRRIDNRRMLRDLDVTLRYPNLASGIGAG